MRQQNVETGRQTPRTEFIRQAARAGLLTLALLTSCTAAQDEGQHRDIPATISTVPISPSTTESRPEYEALYSLRDMVAKAKKVHLSFLRDVCIAWPNAYGYTVVHNPAIFKEGDGAFFPFVPSQSSDKKGVIMNGPTIRLNSDGAFGIADNVTASQELQTGDIGVEDLNATFEIKRFEPATLFTSAWLEAPDGLRVAETTVVADGELNSAFPGICVFESSPVLN